MEVYDEGKDVVNKRLKLVYLSDREHSKHRIDELAETPEEEGE